MRRNLHFLEYLFCHLLLIFLLGRVGFMLYNNSIEDFGPGDVFSACKNGLLAHDALLSSVLLAMPWLVSLLALHWPKLPFRALLSPYYLVIGIVVGVLIVADAVMYEFWQFKLGYVVLSYASSPEGTTNSVSIGFLLSRALTLIALITFITVPCILLTPKRLEGTSAEKQWFRNISIIWTFMLVCSVFTLRVGNAYYSPSLFLNHAATNPVLAFVSTIPKDTEHPDHRLYLNEATCEEVFQDLYPESTEDITDTLLIHPRPNVLLVFMESFGGKFVEELGGIPNVSPNLSRLIPEGIFWENYYSNSFRTDRGTVSTYSGWPSYPVRSIMKQVHCHEKLPSIAKSLEKQGYQTSYLYPGPMTNMGKRQYLANMHFNELLDDTAFEPHEINSSWGANDSTSAMKTYHLIAQKDTISRWFMAYQTISSHEPWDVPYHRLQDKILNAFAYTDHCVGQLVDSLRTLPAWDNMLVIIIPDHGFLYQQSFQDPEFFHNPMLWLGGAIRKPRSMKVLMNQSDLAATLLSQMQITHREYPWSRNVLSANYTYPFAYCNFPAGVLFKDSTGVSIFDLTALCPIIESPTDDGVRALKAKAILQTSNDALE